MECTQRLGCTQELYASQSEKICPEQIGFLGILGTKYPIKRGPNKIGRDPQTCSIILNLNSISRQHAVINILNGSEYMLMDLDSANKTKAVGVTLQPYMPHPLKNGDTVQFGDVFGIFRLLDEDVDLPITQALDVPETPVAPRHVSCLRGPPTTVPESPDVSDKDCSFISPQHQTNAVHRKLINVFLKSTQKSPNLHLDDSSSSLNDSTQTEVGKKVNIHEMETQYPVSVDDSTDSIFVAETQPPPCENIPALHNMETQLPNDNLPTICRINDQEDMQFDFISNKENDTSINNAETQAPFRVSSSFRSSKDGIPMCIYDANTQIVMEDNKDCSIFDAKTQLIFGQGQNESVEDKLESINEKSKEKVNTSEDEILFDDVVSQSFLDDFDSQPLLPPEGIPLKADLEKASEKENDTKSRDSQNSLDIIRPAKRNVRFMSDESTDCEDEGQVPSVSKSKHNDEDVTDCEDESMDLVSKKYKSDVTTASPDICFEDMPTQVLLENNFKLDTPVKPSTNFEDMLTQKLDQNTTKDADFEDFPTEIIPKNVRKVNESRDEKFEDLPTQIIPKNVRKVNESRDENFEDLPTQIIPKNVRKVNESRDENFEDLPTQIIPKNVRQVNESRDEIFEDFPTQIIPKNVRNVNESRDENFEDLPTQIIPEDVREANTSPEVNFEDLPTQVIPEDVRETNESREDNDQYSEEIVGIFKVPLQTPLKSKKKETIVKPSMTLEKKTLSDDNDKYYMATQEIFDDLCTQKDPSPVTNINKNNNIVSCSTKNSRTTNKVSSNKNEVADKSSESDGEDRIEKFVVNLSVKQIQEVIGFDEKTVGLKRSSSDPSDVEITPKKMRPFNFLLTDLPDSQEIKTNVSSRLTSTVTESSSESETEKDSQDSPFLSRKKKKKAVKMDLTKMFGAETLPTRVITRTRKPTAKIQESALNTKNKGQNILKSKLFSDPEEDIDKEIITENITRLKIKNEKKNIKDSKVQTSNSKVENIEIHSKPNKAKNMNTESTKQTKPVKTKKKETKEKAPEARKSESNKNPKKEAKDESKNAKSDSKGSRQSKSRGRSKDKDPSETKDAKKNICKSKTDTTATETTRSSRSRSRNEAKQSTKEPIEELKRRGRPRKSNKTVDKDVDSAEKVPGESRASLRPRTSKDVSIDKHTYKKDSQTKHEQSAVYNISSGSSADSPKTSKRSAADELEVPSSKRNRSAMNTTTASLRATPARSIRNPRILFTAVSCEETMHLLHQLEKLGATAVTEVSSCTVVLTKQIKRTLKLLCAVGLGRPIVGPPWVKACVNNNTIVDPWLYLLKDPENEKRYQFSLERTLAGPRRFLHGYHVTCTPSVKPEEAEMKQIVECSGGEWVSSGPRWVCLTCAADRALWPDLVARGAQLVSTEFILTGVLRQAADVRATSLRMDDC